MTTPRCLLDTIHAQIAGRTQIESSGHMECTPHDVSNPARGEMFPRPEPGALIQVRVRSSR